MHGTHENNIFCMNVHKKNAFELKQTLFFETYIHVCGFECVTNKNQLKSYFVNNMNETINDYESEKKNEEKNHEEEEEECVLVKCDFPEVKFAYSYNIFFCLHFPHAKTINERNHQSTKESVDSNGK